MKKNNNRSLIVAYILWFIGGIMGWHLSYLNRPKHALCYSLTLGGCFISWLLDFVRLPSLVHETNGYLACSSEYIDRLELTQKYSPRRPKPLYLRGFAWQYVLGLWCGFLASCLLPSSSDSDSTNGGGNGDDDDDMVESLCFVVGAGIGVSLASSMVLPIDGSFSAFKTIVIPLVVKMVCDITMTYHHRNNEQRRNSWGDGQDDGGKGGGGGGELQRVSSTRPYIVLAMFICYYTRKWEDGPLPSSSSGSKDKAKGDDGGGTLHRARLYFDGEEEEYVIHGPNNDDVSNDIDDRGKNKTRRMRERAMTTRRKKRGGGAMFSSLLIHAMGLSLFGLVVLRGLLEHGKIHVRNQQTGHVDTYTFRNAFTNVVQSPVWSNLGMIWEELVLMHQSESSSTKTKKKKSGYSDEDDRRHRRFQEAWERIKLQLDPSGLMRAHQELGLQEYFPPGADMKLVKKTYKTLALQYHPDKLSNRMEYLSEREMNIMSDKFLRVQRAYEMLKDHHDASSNNRKKRKNGDEL